MAEALLLLREIAAAVAQIDREWARAEQDTTLGHERLWAAAKRVARRLPRVEKAAARRRSDD